MRLIGQDAVIEALDLTNLGICAVTNVFITREEGEKRTLRRRQRQSMLFSSVLDLDETRRRSQLEVANNTERTW